MPNGSDKNWRRLAVTAEGFFQRYGHWPDRISVPHGCFEDLHHGQLLPDSWAALQKRMRVLPSDLQFVAEGAPGELYEYCDETNQPFDLAESFESWSRLHADGPDGDLF